MVAKGLSMLLKPKTNEQEKKITKEAFPLCYIKMFTLVVVFFFWVWFASKMKNPLGSYANGLQSPHQKRAAAFQETHEWDLLL